MTKAEKAGWLRPCELIRKNAVGGDYDGAIIRMIKRSNNVAYMLLQSPEPSDRTLALGKYSLMNNEEEQRALATSARREC